jgi:hypothetical protein
VALAGLEGLEVVVQILVLPLLSLLLYIAAAMCIIYYKYVYIVRECLEVVVQVLVPPLLSPLSPLFLSPLLLYNTEAIYITFNNCMQM